MPFKRSIAGVDVPRGSRCAGRLTVAGLDPALHPTFTAVAGDEPGPLVAITAGIHGGEYNGIEAAIRLTGELPTDQLRGTVVIVPVANPPAFFNLSHNGSPLDGKNLNRVFPGDPAGSATLRLAAAIAQEIYDPADAVVDLHGADSMEDLLPFVMVAVGAPPEAERMARSYGIELLTRAASRGSTIDWLTSRGIPAILAEAGAYGHLREDAIALHMEGCRGVLRTLGVLGGEPPVPVGSDWQQIAWVSSPATGCFYPSVKAGDRVVTGTTLGRIGSFAGTIISEIRAAGPGRVIFVKQAMATREGNTLFGIAFPL